MAANLSATRDHLHTSDKGELVDPQQTAGFTVDPFLTPISTSSLPHPMHPDPTPSSDPELFDASTRHPNSHYDPAKKLSKKKRNKKLGLGGVEAPHPTAMHAGGRTFSEREQLEHERAERRDSEIGHGEEEEEDGEEDEDDEGDETQEEQQSHAQHAENRVTGSEQSGQQKPDTKSAAAAGTAGAAAGAKEGDSDKQSGGDKERQEDAGGDDKSGGSSLLKKAGGLLSSAQETASGVLASASGTVGGLLSKVGIGGGKESSSSKEDNDQATKEEA